MTADTVKGSQGCDVVIASLGDSEATIGESKIRTNPDLPGFQTNLVKALVGTGKPVVIILLSGRPTTINRINRHVPAVPSAWFPGKAGGTAIAGVLFGDYNPGGKMTVTFLRAAGQLPSYFPFKPFQSDGTE